MEKQSLLQDLQRLQGFLQYLNGLSITESKIKVNLPNRQPRGAIPESYLRFWSFLASPGWDHGRLALITR